MYIHVYTDSPTSGGTDGTEVSEEISTTLASAAAISETTITVDDATNFYTGLKIKIDSEIATISSLDYDTNIITLSDALTVAHSSSATVKSVANESSPITYSSSVTAGNESGTITLAIRTETGYETTGSTVITPDGTTSSYWALSADGSTWKDYGAALTITSTITVTNTLFYAKYKSASSELTLHDKTVNFNVATTIVATS